MSTMEEFLIPYKQKLSRNRFAVECLEKLMQMMPLQDFVFSPYSIYEGLMMVYFASNGDTEKRLKTILHLPDNFAKANWLSYYSKEIRKNNREKFNKYYDQKICWIHKNKNLKDVTSTLFNPQKCLKLDPSTSNFKQEINTVLKNEMQDCLLSCINFKNITENMEFILSSVLCFKGQIQQANNLFELENNSLRAPKISLSSKLKVFVTELPFGVKQSLYMLFPAEQLNSHTWKTNENLIEVIKKLSSDDTMTDFYTMLDDNTSLEQLSRETFIHPINIFEVQEELPVSQLLFNLNILQLLEPNVAELNNFTQENLLLGSCMHRAYIKVTEDNVIARAINMFLTKDELTLFKTYCKDTSYTKQNRSFVWLIYDKFNRTILFTGVINKSPEQEPVSLLLRTRSASVSF
ncbi:serine protease inhibitor 88Ea-like [Nylanderia fulva]|uniref:serine protease inhibitor 88Ea-like n=1 Tax=Nylanderia fulva TaxID=613905 RepID=UPI0010FB7DF3|nr:serine protease inhibitor 88Ea-like [Nylanderia fulva]